MRKDKGGNHYGRPDKDAIEDGRAPFRPALEFARRQRSTAVVIDRQGRRAAAFFRDAESREQPTPIRSATKSIVAMLVGVAMRQGALRGLDEELGAFFPEWRGQPRGRILIRHLLCMTSGLRNPPLWIVLGAEDGGWLGKLSLDHPPGSRWDYNTAAYRLLFTILERSTGMSLADFSEQHLFKPLGMVSSRWRCGYRGEAEVCFDVESTAEDLICLGRLVLQGGYWQGRTLIDADYVAQMIRPSQGLKPVYGFLFWVNAVPRCLFPDAPADAAVAMGARYTRLYLVPSLGLCVTRLGERAALPGERRYGQRDRRQTFDNVFLRLLVAACDHDAQSAGAADAEMGWSKGNVCVLRDDQERGSCDGGMSDEAT
jgi:CubicO group peptidase (beta-lactamase class C family)